MSEILYHLSRNIYWIFLVICITQYFWFNRDYLFDKDYYKDAVKTSDFWLDIAIIVFVPILGVLNIVAY